MQNEIKYITKIDENSNEFAHQSRLFEWCSKQKHLPVLQSKLIFSVGNEEKSNSVVVGARRKASGVKSGVADVILLYPNHQFHALCLELKRHGGKQSEEQKIFEQQAKSYGYAYKLCFSWLDAAEAILEYLRHV